MAGPRQLLRKGQLLRERHRLFTLTPSHPCKQAFIQFCRMPLDASSKVFEAAERGDLELLRQCLATAMPVDLPDPRKSPGGVPTKLTPLMWACRQGQSAAARALLDACASVGVRDAFGREALRHAAACGHADCTRLILQAGGAVNAKDIHGWSAIARAAHRGHSSIVRMLLDAGGTASVAVAKTARKAGHEQLAKLLESRASTQRDGGMPLEAASSEGAKLTVAGRAGGSAETRADSRPPASTSATMPCPTTALLGRGVFSEVFESAHDSQIAVKVTKPFDASGRTKADVSRGKMVLRELRIARALSTQPHVVKLLASSMNGASSPLIIYLSYVRATTDLQRLVNSSLRRQALFAKAAARRLACTQLLDGLACMHTHGVCHRDLKPANILCSESRVGSMGTDGVATAAKSTAAVRGSESGAPLMLLLQLCDFGSARSLGSSAPRRSGTLWYRPPEVVLGSEAGGGGGGGSCTVCAAHDLWACGATLTELLTGKPLLAANDEAHYATLHAGLGEDPSGRVPRGAGRDEAAVLALLLSDDASVRANVGAIRSQNTWAGEQALGDPQHVEQESSSAGATVNLDDIEAASSASAILQLLASEVAVAQPEAKKLEVDPPALRNA